MGAVVDGRVDVEADEAGEVAGEAVAAEGAAVEAAAGARAAAGAAIAGAGPGRAVVPALGDGAGVGVGGEEDGWGRVARGLAAGQNTRKGWAGGGGGGGSGGRAGSRAAAAQARAAHRGRAALTGGRHQHGQLGPWPFSASSRVSLVRVVVGERELRLGMPRNGGAGEGRDLLFKTRGGGRGLGSEASRVLCAAVGPELHLGMSKRVRDRIMHTTQHIAAATRAPLHRRSTHTHIHTCSELNGRLGHAIRPPPSGSGIRAAGPSIGRTLDAPQSRDYSVDQTRRRTHGGAVSLVMTNGMTWPAVATATAHSHN